MDIKDVVPNWRNEKSFDELNGKIHLSYVFDSDGDDDGDLERWCEIYCGPAIDYNGVSDSIDVSDYLKKITDELGIKIWLDCSENGHTFETENTSVAKKWFKDLKERIEKDFVIDKDYY
jgi:hypothetical protein